MSKCFRFCLYLMVFLTIFNFTSALTSGIYITSSLGGDSTISPYEITFYGLGNTCSFGLGHHFAKIFGKRHVLFFCLVLFFIANCLCAMAPTFFLFVLARFFTGLATGPLYPISFNIINENCSQDEVDNHFSYLSLMLAAGPTIGGAYGGWIAYGWNWRWIFHLQGPIILALAYIVYRNEKLFQTIDTKPFDWIGYVFFVLGTASGVSAITLGQQLDWFRSPFICFLVVLSPICGLFFFLWNWNHENPYFTLKLYKNIEFSLGVFAVFLLYLIYFGSLISLSLWLHIDVNYTPNWVGLVVLASAFSAGFFFVLVRKWKEKMISLEVICFGILLFAIACFYSETFNSEINFGRLFMARSLMGFALAFFLFPLLVHTVRSTALPERDHATAIFQSTRFLAGSLGAIIFSTIWLRRKVFYHERLGEQLTASSSLTTEALNQTALYGPKGLKAKLLLNEALAKQADALALADCFHLMCYLLLFVFFTVLARIIFLKIMKKKQEKEKIPV